MGRQRYSATFILCSIILFQMSKLGVGDVTQCWRLASVSKGEEVKASILFLSYYQTAANFATSNNCLLYRAIVGLVIAIMS